MEYSPEEPRKSHKTGLSINKTSKIKGKTGVRFYVRYQINLTELHRMTQGRRPQHQPPARDAPPRTRLIRSASRIIAAVQASRKAG